LTGEVLHTGKPASGDEKEVIFYAEEEPGGLGKCDIFQE
jgi:hypothetical protein